MMLLGLRRRIAYRRTRITPSLHNRHAGRVLTTDEWETSGGWEGALEPGWQVERPNWWERGASSGVTAATVEEARARLDEWQEEQLAHAIGRHA